MINVLNLQGQVTISYKLFRAWVSDYQALPDFDAGSMNTVGIQTLQRLPGALNGFPDLKTAWKQR